MPAGSEPKTSRPAHHDQVEGLDPDILAFHFSPTPTADASPQDRDIAFQASPTNFQQESLIRDTSDQNPLFKDLTDQFFNEFEGAAPDDQPGQSYSILEGELSPENFLATMDMRGSSNWLDENSIINQLDANDGLNPQVLGYSGDMDPYLLQNYRYDLSGAFKFKQLSIHSVCQGNVPTQFLLSQPGLFSGSRQEMGIRQIPPDASREKLEALVSVDTGVRLIAMFRRFILPQYPIFSDSLFPNPQSSPPYLLAAIYMVAQPFARSDDVLSIELAYETLDNQALFKFVDEALQYEAHNPNLSVVQTLLLLVLRPSTNHVVLESSFKWSLHGALVSTSQSLGLHYDPSSWNIAHWQIALRRRISFTIFALDKWLATSLGRPPLITRDTWLVTSPTTADGYASSMSPELWSAHVCYAKLGPLLGDVLTKLFSLRAINELASDIRRTLDVSKTLLEELSDWHEESVQPLHEHSGEAASLPTICALGHHYVQITIFRAIMRPFLTTSKTNTDTTAAVNQESRDQQDVMGFARKGVRSSTTAAANFVKSLTEEHFHMFWPHWSQVAFSSICFLDLMMAISSPDTQEAITWFRDLHIARKEMRLKATMLPVLRLGLLRIDAVFWKGVEKVLQLPPHVKAALEASLASSRG
ncbi:Nn.00g101990.m01.CDS01 [Neocucurbitaria sp. VM-36]